MTSSRPFLVPTPSDVFCSLKSHSKPSRTESSGEMSRAYFGLCGAKELMDKATRKTPHPHTGRSEEEFSKLINSVYSQIVIASAVKPPFSFS
ncbi:hypothetical protein BaRGS_00020678 [Batillaria attramentaria]|uniref:Uncharacterized protein n=1 Tax=Batillaria attramentaria TaxID=370345 RepID=A0ABD0KLS8_9CAEN